MAEIRLEKLSFRYPGADADTLSDLSLDIGSGEAHALLGGSGAGKSTLLNLLSGLLPMDRGQMIFNDEDVSTRTPLERRVSQVFQFPVLYEAMTVEDNLRFPLRCTGASRATARERAADIAKRLNLEGLLKRKPIQLSLVEKQLVAIGKSLVRPDVSLVLLDEPLTAAQPAYKWQLRQALKSVQRELGTTMVYVTHDQTEALTFADRISVLHDGRIVQTATPEILVSQPAHEHVGYFVGSPGMNFLDARIEDGAYRVGGADLGEASARDGLCRIGFRPEWASLVSGPRPAQSAVLSAQILQTRILGTAQGIVHGLVTARCGNAEVITRQALDEVSMGEGWLCLDRSRLFGFRDGVRIDGAGIERTGADHAL